MAQSPTRVPAADKQAIREAFPLIARIKDGKLRDGVVTAWYIAWRESPFENLQDAPFAIDAAPGETLVKHSNAAASGAYAMARQLIQEYGVNINLDYVLAGAILHDLDKILRYERIGNRVVASEFGKKIVHGAYGGHIALLAGLPQDIVFIIMAHSGKVDVELRSPEGKLISFAELGKIQALQAATGTLPPTSAH
ncbi:MAG: HDIG domain-containing protein [Chloroflexi bacterium]|nr:HDIG domain-containing protein [Chloroflexota bacterium]